ncbi:HepT-like ribonuclease domain-containing protein [Halarsenatibacter silvermanii]|uniref:Uncharacterized conserved protein, contains HEPN domain n=1 Tax=Halarsenatibacter silvermanii TaxID=321763 RepID=A0A1G9TRM7_9FIRM|nr:HepT-like ribonuclease domain-containing protein [Halarsenatibacter silvermanii]SDM50228.1 Uncharacterized conserved protein, contains HEPN domain [Halarsenatibacter silvermanii]
MIGDRDADALEDILYSIDLLKKYSAGLSEEKFYKNQEKQDLIVHRLEIIGEASSRISDEIKDKYDDIPWEDMINMRNILIHQYDNIFLDIVWKTLKEKIPEVEEEILGIKEEEDF